MIETPQYVICYPGGSGGSFIAAALDSVVNGRSFILDEITGHCHNNVVKKNHIWFDHGSSSESFKQELAAIDSLKFTNGTIFEGHFRNIVAIKEKISEQLAYHAAENTKFIKIIVNPKKINEIRFIAQMLRRKINCFSSMSFEEYLLQTTNYVNSWYWVENAYTLPGTINLSLADIFLNKVSTKINLPETLLTKLDQYQQKYQTVQQHLHQDLLELINE